MADFGFLIRREAMDDNNLLTFTTRETIEKQIVELKDLKKEITIYFDEECSVQATTTITEVILDHKTPHFRIDLNQNDIVLKTKANLDSPLLFEFKYERIPIGFLSKPGTYEKENSVIFFNFPDIIYRLQRRNKKRFTLTKEDNITIEFQEVDGSPLHAPVAAIGENGLAFLLPETLSCKLEAFDDEDDDESSDEGIEGMADTAVEGEKPKYFGIKLRIPGKEEIPIVAQYLYDSSVEDATYSHYIGVKFAYLQKEGREIIRELCTKLLERS